MSLTYEQFGGVARLEEGAFSIVPQGLHRELEDPSFHAPKYHEFSLLEHLRRVCVAAERINEATGVDVRLAAALHDVAKVEMFPRVARGANEAMLRGTLASFKFHYISHERDSAEIAHDEGADERAIWLVANHDASYRGNLATPEKLIAFCDGDQVLLAELMAICAADAVGKGWPEAQQAQRLAIADRFAAAATLAQLAPAFAAAVDDALRRW